jgi:hypothetical protein
VDAITRAVDIRTHTGIPTLRLVAEVNASFKQLAHGELRKSHAFITFPVLSSAGVSTRMRQPADVSGISPPKSPTPPAGLKRCI